MADQVYLDNGASTRTDSRVVKAMLPYFTEQFGNASSLHSYGVDAKEALTKARSDISGFVGAQPEELIFTSSGTESNNLAIKGIAYANRNKGRHIIVSSIEHDCIINSCKWLETQGFEVSFMPVDRYGLVDPQQIASAIRKDTVIVSVMHANNEIGTIEPIEEIGKICKERGVYFHTDACQSFGKIRIDVNKMNIDLMTINSHKIYGPKGVGALYIREGTTITPIMHGGGQEYGIRSSTENIAGIVGFAAAVHLCADEIGTEPVRLTALRDRIIDGAMQILGAYLNGHRTQRLPTNVNLGFHNFEGEAITLMLKLNDHGFAVSTGSACSSNQAVNTPSHVLLAIGLNPIEARGALRISLGRYNTKEEIDALLEVLPSSVKSLRPISSMI